MKSVYRGALAFIGLVAGFLTLVFLSQTMRYLNLALLGDQLSLGMFGIYVVLSFVGGTVTIVCFRPRFTTAKYLSGAGFGVGGMLLLASIYLLTTDMVSGMMLLMITAGQIVAASVVYGLAIAVSNGDEEQSGGEQPDPSPVAEPTPDVEPNTEPVVSESSSEDTPSTNRHESDTSDPEPAADETPSTQSEKPFDTPSTDIDRGKLWRGVQIFTGVTVFLIGLPVTIESPVGVPMMVFGLAIIPAVRRWGMDKLGS